MIKRLALVLILMLICSLALFAGGSAGAAATGWTKIADKGLGNPAVMMMFPFKTFKGKLYFLIPGAGGAPVPAPAWTYDGSRFAKAAADGFGDPNNVTLNPGPEYKGYFYVGTGTWGTGSGQLWRTSDGTHWSRVGASVFTDPNDNTCYPLGVQDGKLLIGFDNWQAGAKVYSYDGSSFERINYDGFGPYINADQLSFASTYGGRVHVVANRNSGGIGGFTPLVYRTGKIWDRTGPNDFGDASNRFVYVTATDGKYLYAGTVNNTVGQVWRYDGTSWKRLDVGPAATTGANILFAIPIEGRLYITTMIESSGPPGGTSQVFREKSSGGFEAWSQPGLGDPANAIIIMGAFKGRIIAGTFNPNGFQVWSYPLSAQIEGITPSSGPYGTTVKITGSGFGTPPAPGAGGAANAFVSFNGAKVYQGMVDSWTDTQIVMEVPEGATEGPVTVFAGGQTSNAVQFEPTLSDTYYFAEGSTRDNPVDGTFQEWICVENPDAENGATIDVTYMMGPGEATKTQRYLMAPASRLTVDVLNDVGAERDVSAVVHADRPIVAERTMYFDYHGEWSGGHAVTGVPVPGKKWYFAEGTTRNNLVDGAFDEYLCLLNPGDEDAEVVVTYMLGDGSTPTFDVTVPAASRVTRNVVDDVGIDKDVSIAISSDRPVVAERPTYFDYRNMWPGGDCVAGLRYPSQQLYFAEGCTYDWANEYLSIQNPNAAEAAVTVDYQLGDGSTTAQNKLVVPPTSRITLDVAAQVGPGKDVSAKLTSDLPIVAERPMYFKYQNVWPGGHVVMGIPALHHQVFFAEGTTRNNTVDGNFDEWLSIQNPGTQQVKLVALFFRSDAAMTIKTFLVPAGARMTLDVNQLLGENMDASALIVSEGPLAVERPMYFSHGFSVGGSDSPGYGL